MIHLLVASALSSLVFAQAPAPAIPSASPQESPVAPALAPAAGSPTDGFGPDLKAWLDATKARDSASASKALLGLQRLRAERNLTTIDDVAGAISGRGEARLSEGSRPDAVEAMSAAAAFAPDSAGDLSRKAAAEGSLGGALSALNLAWANPFDQGRLRTALLLGLLVASALCASGFAFGVVLRYAAVFSHDVSEGVPSGLKPLALFIAVLFVTLPLACLMGWGYLPFWWLTLFFIFQSRAEKAVSLTLLIGFALSGLALPVISHQKVIDTVGARTLYMAANGGTSVEAQAAVSARLAKDPGSADWALLSASLARRAGRYDEATAALQAHAAPDPRFGHNAAAIEFNKGNLDGAHQGFTQATQASLSPRDKATAFYNLSLVQVNRLEFEPSKESRKKGDDLAADTLLRYDRVFSFDRSGSTLQAPPDIVPEPSRLLASSLPELTLTLDTSMSRLTIIALGMLLVIPLVVKVRGKQSFSKRCPKCGTTFCWLCQTRSTSQDVCSQCHHLFVVKRGIPPAARAAKNLAISQYVATKALLHRIASVLAPGSGHLSVGHFTFGMPVLLAWALSAGTIVTVQFLAPPLVSDGPLGLALRIGFGIVALATYIAAQVVVPRPPVLAPPQRRVPKAEQEA